MTTADAMHVRINFSTGEIELTGSPDGVREWWKSLADDVSDFRRRFTGRGVQAAGSIEAVRGRAPQRAGENAIDVPDTFGEFLHRFSADLTDIERALVAGAFVQAQSEANSFTTAEVNELLVQQGVRLANGSASVRRNVDARRAIILGGGHFRVSQSGMEHLASIQVSQI